MPLTGDQKEKSR